VPEDRRLLEMMYREFKMHGLDIIDEVERERFKAIQERICSVAAEFLKIRTGKHFALVELIFNEGKNSCYFQRDTC